MNNQTFTRMDGRRPLVEAKKIRKEVQAYVNAFETEHHRAPTQNEVGKKFNLEAKYAGVVLANLRNCGKIAKTKGGGVAMQTGTLHYVRCIQCGESTCARTAQSETLRGWTHVNMVGNVGVCHKCSKGAK